MLSNMGLATVTNTVRLQASALKITRHPRLPPPVSLRWASFGRQGEDQTCPSSRDYSLCVLMLKLGSSSSTSYCLTSQKTPQIYLLFEHLLARFSLAVWSQQYLNGEIWTLIFENVCITFTAALFPGRITMRLLDVMLEAPRWGTICEMLNNLGVWVFCCCFSPCTDRMQLS